jgi:hypothetical protein
MARSWFASAHAFLAATAFTLAFPGHAAAHRLDEYLQATRIAVAADRVHVEIDLTPGVEVARIITGTIDADRDARISALEARRYASEVIGQVTLLYDGVPRRLTLERHHFPSMAALSDGTGTIRLEAGIVAEAPPGAHRLSFRNGHRPDVGAYLVNVLAPASTEIAIDSQRRDPQQRGMDLDFSVRASQQTSTPAGRFLLALAALTVVAIVIRRRRANS